MRAKRLIRPAIAIAVVAVVGILFARALRDNWEQLREADLSLGVWTVVAMVVFVLAVAVSGTLWGSILGRLSGTPVPRLEAIRVHFAAWLLKYVPGQVGFVLYKVTWGKRRGMSRVLMLISVVYENAFLLLGSTVPMLALLLVLQAGDVRTEPTVTVWAALAAMIPLAAMTHPAVFHRAVNLLGRRALKRDVPTDYFLPFRSALGYQAAFLLPRVVNGVGVAVIAAAVADAPASTWVPIGAAYAIAGAVGILAVFVPSGIGVRESVFVLFAAPYLSVEMAIVVALAARVLSTVADAIIAAAYGGLTVAARTKEQ